MKLSEAVSGGAGVLPRVDLSGDRREERRSVRIRARRHGMILGALLILGVTLLAPLTLHVVALRRQLQKSQEQARDIASHLQVATAESERIDAQIASGSRFQQNQQARQAWSGLLPVLAGCLPDEVSVQQVSVVVHGKDAQIQMQMTAASMEGLHDFTVALGHSAPFSRVRLLQTTADHLLGSHGISFQMSGPVGGTLATGAGSGS